MTPLDLAGVLRDAHGHAQGSTRKRRIVCRFDPTEIERIDTLKAQLRKKSRAAVIRALCLLAFTAIGPSPEAPKVTP